jgi:hypothetical protein
MSARYEDNQVEEDRASFPGLVGSLIMVILANAVPVAGVFWFGWDAFLVVFAYWLEGVVVGCFTLLKIVWTLPGYDPTPGQSVQYARKNKDVSENFTVTQLSKWAVVPAFTGVYGGLMLVYGLLMLMFLDGRLTVAAVTARLSGDASGLLTVLVIMLAQHAWIFYTDFVCGPEWAKSDPVFHFWGPFGRFILLQLLVVIGGVVTRGFSLPRFYLVLFIFLKSCGELLSALFRSAGPWRRIP